MKVTVELHGFADVHRTFAALGNPKGFKKAVAATAEDVELYVKQQAAKHNGHGALVCSVEKRRTSDGRGWEVFHNPQVAPHALFVHWGTRAHVIRPRNKKVLRWPVGGRFAFAKEVHHPGTRPDTWMVRAAELAPRIFAWHLDAQLQKLKG